MEIKRTTEILVETRRRLVIVQPEYAGRILCPQCGERMIEAEIAAALLAVSRRFVYRQIEKPDAHFVETGAGILFVCPDWLADGLPKPE
jgi:predicted RNA-binding Zn-ribbon protein involved in translation (DUF1610 family)